VEQAEAEVIILAQDSTSQGGDGGWGYYKASIAAPYTKSFYAGVGGAAGNGGLGPGQAW
jgi:hypothetical protein